MNNCLSLSLDNTCEFLNSHDNYIILTHRSPDGDTLGSAFSLCRALGFLGKNSYVICPDAIPPKFNYFANQCGVMPKAENATVISVDVADVKLLGGLQAEYEEKIELAIDHHISNTRFAKRLYLDSTASAACECIYDIILKLGVKIDKDIANGLFTGIATDTGCFKYSNTTSKTHMIAAKLMGYGIDAAHINKLMFDTKSRERMEIERLALDSAEFYFNDKCCIIGVTNSMKQKSGCSEDDLEGIAILSRCVEGVLIGATMRQTNDNSYKVSVRTYPPFDASKICANFGGGGHVAAAGCTIEGDLDTAKAKLVGCIKNIMEETDAGSYSDK